MHFPALARVALGLIAIAAAAAVAAPPVWAQGQITIMADWVDPPTLRATLDERVFFINRSGRMVHVEFTGDSGRHHVFQVPNQIWAEFHRAGRHPYLVHFPDLPGIELRGTVEVMGDPKRVPGSDACNGLTVLGACLER